MATSIGTATLTASWATVGAAVGLLGLPVENRSGGTITVRFKHVKHASQSGGYPVVRFRFQVHNAANAIVDTLDPVPNGTITIVNGVATVVVATAELAMTCLTDSTGTPEGAVILQVPPFMEYFYVQAKQTGDTTNFGTLAIEYDGRI